MGIWKVGRGVRGGEVRMSARALLRIEVVNTSQRTKVRQHSPNNCMLDQRKHDYTTLYKQFGKSYRSSNISRRLKLERWGEVYTQKRVDCNVHQWGSLVGIQRKAAG